MNRQEAVELMEYDQWASDLVLNAAEAAGDQKFTAEPKSQGIGSMRDLMVHVADGQWMWLQRLKGEPLPVDKLFKYGRMSTVKEVREHCKDMAARFTAYLSSAGPDEFNRSVTYTPNPAGTGPQVTTPVWEIILQVSTHGVHHRSEVCELLSQIGHRPEDVNYQRFFTARFRAAAAANKPAP